MKLEKEHVVAVAAFTCIFVAASVYLDIATYQSFFANQSQVDCAQFRPLIDYAKNCLKDGSYPRLDCTGVAVGGVGSRLRNFTGTAGTWPTAFPPDGVG